MRSIYTITIAASAALGSACAGAPTPTDQLVKTEAALRAAREVGAEKIPSAELHAKLADEQLARANKLIEDGENADAKRQLVRAQADAEYALALARKAEAERQLHEAQSKVPQTAASTPAPVSLGARSN